MNGVIFMCAAAFPVRKERYAATREKAAPGRRMHFFLKKKAFEDDEYYKNN
jgi:hypothetical protein